MELVFISSPYSHSDSSTVDNRVRQVSEYTAKLVAAGVTAFSPIVYGHTLLQHHDMPTDWEFWKNFCETFLSRTTELHVLMLPGWDISSGVVAEIEYARSNNIPVKHIQP